MCCMSREKVSISLDKDENRSPSLSTTTHMVKAVPLTSWHLTKFKITDHEYPDYKSN